MLRALAVAALVVGCSQPATHNAPPPTPKIRPGAGTLTILGTNDLHGAISRLPIFAGYVANVRAARAADGGGVLVIDAGDMFQGTLESNLNEGAAVIRAYNAIGYAAAAVGNHEFDFGPAGPAATPHAADDDARGALKARAREAKFPIMTANILDQSSGARIKWPNMPGATIVEVAGTKVGIIGASTESTPYTTMPANFVGLVMQPPADAIVREARRLRDAGARVIVVTAHIGSRCEDLDHPNDASSCDIKEELFRVIADLPRGLVDVFIAGHTHAAIAHRIADIAVIESYASGRAFGRVDLRIAPDGHVTAMKIHKPQDLCPGEAKGKGNLIPAEACKPGPYEGRPVAPDRVVQAIVDDALGRANERRREPLGVTLTSTVRASYGEESAEGNLFTDLMLAAQPDADVAVTNGGGLRADLPAGPLTYGALFEAMPFDNRFAIVAVKGVHLRKLVMSNLQRGGAFLSWGGLTAKARCRGEQLEVSIRVKGKPLADDAGYKLVTSDFLASGGDGLIGRLRLPDGSVQLTDTLIREAMADVLRRRKGTIDPAQLLGPKRRRIEFAGQRPVLCAHPRPSPNEDPAL